MSRSGYSDDYDHVELYRHTVERAIRGMRGQYFFKRLRDALDAMPVKRLISGEIRTPEGVCALGALEPTLPDPYDHEGIGKRLNIATCLAAEVEYMNDEWPVRNETPEQRWTRMRAWVEAQISPTLPHEPGEQWHDDKIEP